MGQFPLSFKFVMYYLYLPLDQPTLLDDLSLGLNQQSGKFEEPNKQAALAIWISEITYSLHIYYIQGVSY